MRTIGVIGLGLIGGSIALGFKEKGFHVVGVEKDSDVSAYALDRKIIDEAGSIETLKGAEAVFVCVPVGKTREVMEKAVGVLGGDTLVTDVASVKGILSGMSGRFVGGHPMAGTEKSGIAAARPHLFENAFYAVVKYENTSDADVEQLVGLVRILKAKPVVMTAEEHDERASKVSHLPHMAAYALSGYALKTDGFTGTGFMDTTRIAASDPKFWTDVAFLNRENLLNDMKGFKSEFDAVYSALEKRDRDGLYKLLFAAREKREQLELKRVYLNDYTLDVDIRDEVGAVARVSKILADNGINISGLQIIYSREGIGGALRISVVAENDYVRAKELLGIK